jgi:hypothetical protein
MGDGSTKDGDEVILEGGTWPRAGACGRKTTCARPWTCPSARSGTARLSPGGRPPHTLPPVRSPAHTPSQAPPSPRRRRRPKRPVGILFAEGADSAAGGSSPRPRPCAARRLRLAAWCPPFPGTVRYVWRQRRRVTLATNPDCPLLIILLETLFSRLWSDNYTLVQK